nr:cytochrome b [Sycophaga agraensis]
MMKKSLLKNYNLLLIMKNSLISLPSPMNINIWWNFGSLLGICLLMQIITGFFLSMHYNANINNAFESMIHITNNVNLGWLFREMHACGASMFFLLMFCHIGRGLYYNSFVLKSTWFIGIIIFITSMATAFLGYVLPWGQMSYWGATVITNLLSVIPKIGNSLVIWLWGGFSVSNPTLNRFYSFHFILPFIVSFMIIIHLMFLHETGSTNPLGLNSNFYKISFNPYFVKKDLIWIIIIIMFSLMIMLQLQFLLFHPDNFMIANPMVTPSHIQPEWYFLFAYTILRAIPSKLGGVFAMFMSILIFLTLPFTKNYKMKGFQFYFFNKILFWLFIINFISLTWLGAMPVNNPYIFLSQISSMLYFLYFFLSPMIANYWDKKLF